MSGKFKVEKVSYVNKTFRMEEKLVENLQKVASKEGISLNALVVQACQFALQEYDDQTNNNSICSRITILVN